MTDVDRLLEVASSQLGTAEDPRGSNRILYNTAYYGREVSGSQYPWCMVFVWWCFREAGLSRLFYGGGKAASCTALKRWAEREGQWVTGDYRPGDVLLYQIDEDAYADHTGILVRADGSALIAIEGNTNDKVARVRRTPDQLWGAWRPPYRKTEESIAPAADSRVDASRQSGVPQAEDTPSPGAQTATILLPELAKGAVGETVRAMQILLIGRGYHCGRWAADGDFGDDTALALLRFQQRSGLAVDGICGERTWTKLLKGD